MEEEIVIEFPPMVAKQPIDNPPDLMRSCSPFIKLETKSSSLSSIPVPSRSATPSVSPELSPKSILRHKNTTKEGTSPKSPPSLPLSPKQTYLLKHSYTPKKMLGSVESLPNPKMKSLSQPQLENLSLHHVNPPIPPKTYRGTKKFRPVMMTNGSLLLHSARPVSPFEISV